MKRLRNIKWYTKLIVAGLLLIAVGNPLSLIFISSGIDLAVIAFGDLLQAGVVASIHYSLYIVGVGAVAIILGGGAYLGSREKTTTAKYKNLKHRSTKTPEYLEV